MEKVIVDIRGATSVENFSIQEISERTKELMEELFRRNKVERIISITFSVTEDINLINPASIARKAFGLDHVSLMCLKEAQFEGSINGIIRVSLLCESPDSNFVYLHRACMLRPDLK